MIRGQLFILICHNFTFLFNTGDNSVYRIINIIHRNLFFIVACSKKCRFIQQVLQVCTGKSGSTLCKSFQINFFIQFFIFSMYLQNLFSASHVRSINIYLPVKSSRTQQCVIQNIRSVCCCNYNYICIFVKSIHFNQ